MALNCIWLSGSSFGDLECVKYLFIVITPRSTLTFSGSTCKGPIYGSNKSVWKLLVLDRNSWYNITEQIIHIKNSYLKLCINY